MKRDKLHKIFQSSPPVSEETISKYLKGTLNAEKRFEMENQMLDDPLLNDAMEGFSEANVDFLSNDNIESFEDFLGHMNISEDAKVRSIQPKRTGSYRLAIAASIILLVAFGTFFLLSDESKISNDQLFAQNFEIATMEIPQLRGDSATDINAEINPLLQSAIEAYQKEDFKASLKAFNNYIINVNPDNNFALFHSGICALKTNQLEVASQNFTKLYVHKGEFYEEANWYLALTNIQKNDMNGAKELLTTLVEKASNPKLKNKASALLDSF